MPVERVAPCQSKPDRRAPGSPPARPEVSLASTAKPSPMANDIMGRLTKKTALHPNRSSRKPPRAGPTMAPLLTTPIISPIALPRSLAGKEAAIMAIPVPWVMAAPAP